jgi:hypothetical protein
MHASTGFETPKPSSIPLFLLQLWKTHGHGTVTPEAKTMKKKMTMTTRLKKKTLSEDIIFPSFFLVFDAKGGRRRSLAMYIFLRL